MRTLGIDLSSKPERTAACVIDWMEKEARVTTLKVGVDDSCILSLAVDSDWTGIDAPFGWPDEFVAMISQHQTGSADLPPLSDELKKKLCYRLTDHRVFKRTGKWPLAVAADRIAIVTMRGIRLLAKLGVKDRSGVDGVVEVYPAAALRRWCFDPKGYKGKNEANIETRTALLTEILEEANGLVIPKTAEQLCNQNDHAFDALICALIARAAALDLTERPAANELATAQREGWIALPAPDSLALLAASGPIAL